WPSESHHQVIAGNQRRQFGALQRSGRQGQRGIGQAATCQAVPADVQLVHAEQRQRLQVGAQVLLLQQRRLLVGQQLQHAVVHEQQGDGQLEGPAGQGDIQGLAGGGARPGGLTTDQQQRLGHQSPPKQTRRSAICAASCSWPRPDSSQGAVTLTASRP